MGTYHDDSIAFHASLEHLLLICPSAIKVGHRRHRETAVGVTSTNYGKGGANDEPVAEPL